MWIPSCLHRPWVHWKRAVAANRLAPAWWPERNWMLRETNESLRDKRHRLRFVLDQSFACRVVEARMEAPMMRY